MSGPVGALEQKAWGKAQTTYDTFQSYAATDGFDFRELSIDGEVEYHEIESHVGTLSLQGEIEGKRGGKWSVDSYLRPTTAGTAPDLGFMFTHALGTETVGGSDVTYTLNDDAPSGLEIYRSASTDFMECIGGAWIEELELAIEGGSPPTMKAGGGFASRGFVMQGATIGASEATGQTILTVTSGHARYFQPGVFVTFPSDTNGGAGYRVTSVDVAGNTITVTPAIAGAGLSNLDAITPLILTQTLVGTPIPGIACGLSLGGTAIGLKKATIKYATGTKGIEGEASSNRPSRLHRGKRLITGELEVFYLAESAPFMERAYDPDTGYLAAIIRAGADTASKRVLFNLPRIRLGNPKYVWKDEEATHATFPFKARQSATAGDELNVVWS
jgi:hypothetical protein